MIGPLAGVGILALVGGALAVAMDRVALALVRPPQKPPRPKVEALPYDVEARAFLSSGQPLLGHLVRPDSDNRGPAVVLVHGWGSSHGNLVRLALPLLRHGHPVFLFDVRHHGASPPSRFVTARHYRDDIIAACQEAGRLLPGRSLVLIGHSMGGACSILAAAEGAPISGLISISAPADLWEVWAYHFDRQGLPGKWIVRVLNPFWRRRAGTAWKTLDPVLRAGELALPVLVIHGTRDESVPWHHARTLGEATGTDPWLLEGQGHSDLLDHPHLHARIQSFLEELGG